MSLCCFDLDVFWVASSESCLDGFPWALTVGTPKLGCSNGAEWHSWHEKEDEGEEQGKFWVEMSFSVSCPQGLEMTCIVRESRTLRLFDSVKTRTLWQLQRLQM